MYKIKEKPEDFIVEEVTNVIAKDKGRYKLYWMTKKDYTTADAVKRIAKKLRIKERFIGFAGTKDKKAITKQLVGIPFISKEKIENLGFDGLKLDFYGNNDEPVSLGDLEGNNFEIVVRNLDGVEVENKKIKNFYGEQRFSKQNADIGKLIVKKDFKKAAEKIAESERDVKEYLDINEKDYIGALRRLALKILKIYVHAYQSYLWNKIALQIDEDCEIPIIGFDTEVKDEKIEKIMKEEGINYRDFIIKEIPELSSEGGKRELFVKPKDFEILEKGEDELNKGKKKIKLKFFLPKGSYATEAIRQLF
ncbi:tRNA pseudouridine(13) synthase TruD [Candidatus Woesearchaeota archaeon]|nr:tRNA pseudouridine(13) synthase TruD [Candidatus Woesearchaeota archaeon]